MRHVKAFEEFHFDLDPSHYKAFIPLIAWLVGKFIFMPSYEKKQLLKLINDKETTPKGYDVVRNDDKIQVTYDTLVDGKRVLFEVDTKTRKIMYINTMSKPLEAKLSKFEFSKMMSMINKTGNFKEELVNFFQEVTDDYHYKPKLIFSNVGLTEITIRLERESNIEITPGGFMGRVRKKFDYKDNINEFPEVLGEAIARIEGEYNVRLCGRNEVPQETIGRTHYIFKNHDELYAVTKSKIGAPNQFWTPEDHFDDDESTYDDLGRELGIKKREGTRRRDLVRNGIPLSMVDFLRSRYTLIFKASVA